MYEKTGSGVANKKAHLITTGKSVGDCKTYGAASKNAPIVYA